MTKFISKNLYAIFISVLVFSIGVLLGRYTKEPQVIKNKVLRESGYKYINPVLLCNTDNQQEYNHDTELSDKLFDYVKKNSSNNISVYYLSLTNGYWASINENGSYSPASMLKIPTVVDALKYSEANPNFVSKEIYFEGLLDEDKKQNFKPLKSIQAGEFYTFNELIDYIIKYSDNNALTLLTKNINSRSLNELYADLNISIPKNTIDFMNVKTFSLFLRILYNSTYLSRENSEKVLKLMTESDFSIGLRNSLPKEIEVASKFGEQKIIDTGGKLIKNELHECGIVYQKDNPYILCVMTSGASFESLSVNISDISKIVFDHVNN